MNFPDRPASQDAGRLLCYAPAKRHAFVATSDDLPGLVAQGRTLAETVEIAQGLSRRIYESCIEHGDPLPSALAAMHSQAVAVDLLIPVGTP